METSGEPLKSYKNCFSLDIVIVPIWHLMSQIQKTHRMCGVVGDSGFGHSLCAVLLQLLFYVAQEGEAAG